VCGIAGIFRSGEVVEDLGVVRAMLEALRPRGPDGAGVFHESGVTLGHRRLAILDLSEAGHQPMRSVDGRFIISHNGEVYNFQDLRRELGLAPTDLRSKSDTEVILHAWDRWGPGALDRMVGQWAFALFDRLEGRLWLARDRFGEKPLFYHEQAGVVTFASSLQALLRVSWMPRAIDPEALAEYLTLRYVVAPRTILTGIRKLAPGHLLTVGPDGVQVRRWYSPRFNHHMDTITPLKRCDLVDEFGALLMQATRRCLVSDVPVGILLSDGIDSNSLRHALALSGERVPAFTYRAAASGDSCPGGVSLLPGATNEASLAFTPEERLRHLEPAFSSLTEPIGDGAALALWLLIHSARPRAKVFLSGSGGDEVLGGYRLDQDRLRLAAIRRCSWLPATLLRRVLARHTSGTESASARLAALRRASKKQVPAIARYLVNRPLPAQELEQLYRPLPFPGRYLEAIDRLYDETSDSLADLDRIQEVMLRTFLSENILSHGDSVAMSSSAELRLPFLDRDLVGFVLRLPPSLRVRRWPGRASTKILLRLWMDGHPRRNGATRRKRTFNYGSVRQLLAVRRDRIHELILGAKAVRRELPGLEGWLKQPADSFRGPREGTLWAVLALGIWCEAIGVR
jgi:asparagine synthase (glutamine-hydrolysing)